MRARPSSMNIKARRATRERAASIVPSGTFPSRATILPLAALTAAAGLLLLTGCSGAALSSSSASSPGQRAALPAAVPSAEPAAGGPALPAGSGQQTANQAVALAPASQSIIYTATLTVDVRAVMTAANRATGAVTAAGGYTAGEQAQAVPGGGQRPQVTLTLKVPVEGYGQALAQLGRLGRQTSLSQQAQDVTEEVADVDSRVTSEEDEIAQLRDLLGRTGSVSDLLQVQDQLGSDESELEALQAQQRALDHETSYATITLRLLGPLPRAAARPAARHGFGAGLAAGWRGLRHATSWLLTVLGAALPFAVVLAVLGGLAYGGRRRLGRLVRRRPAPPAEPAA